MKMRISLILVFSLIVPMLFYPSFSFGDTSSERLIVLFEDSNSMANVKKELTNNGVFSESFNILNGLVIHANERAIEKIMKSKGILSIEVDQVVNMLPKKEKPGKPGNDTEEPSPQIQDWGLSAINAQEAWSVYTGLGVKVAVIDTGIDINHQDLVIYGGVNYVAKARSYDDDNGHGTHVAGIIAATNNEEGVVGVAFESKLYAVKALDRRGSGYLSDVIRGIEWSIENQMDVINMSLGSDNPSISLENVLDYAKSQGLIVIAAAGNDSSAVDYPGAYSSTIAVGAVDNTLALANFSSNGPEVDIVAPGVNIYSTYKSGAYRTLNGTSMATPYIAGLAAMYKQKNPSATLAEFRNALINGSQDLGNIGFDTFFGYGLPDIVKVLE